MFTTKDKILIGGGFIFALVLVGIGLFFSPRTPEQKGNQIPLAHPPDPITIQVELVEPLVGQKGLSVVPQLLVDFSEDVTDRHLELKTKPKANFTAFVKTDGDKAIFSPAKNLKTNINYSFQVLVDGDAVFSWSASTENRGTSQNNLATVVNKIRGKLPYNQKSFGVSYDGATDQFFVFIEKAPIETTKSRANQWFRRQGLKDFGALNINYSVTGSLLR